MLYELRVYDITPLRMKDINDRFAKHTIVTCPFDIFSGSQAVFKLYLPYNIMS